MYSLVYYYGEQLVNLPSSNNQFQCGIATLEDVAVLEVQRLAVVLKHLEEEVHAALQK